METVKATEAAVAVKKARSNLINPINTTFFFNQENP
jgi:hypothetical protein